jgi:hypothetical protein
VALEYCSQVQTGNNRGIYQNFSFCLLLVSISKPNLIILISCYIEYLRGKYHCTIDLFDWFGISCMTIVKFCFYLQNRLLKTSQTGGHQYNDTSLFSIPWLLPNQRYFTTLKRLIMTTTALICRRISSKEK